ncbi:MAG: ROK family protein [Rhodothermales bacterium]
MASDTLYGGIEAGGTKFVCAISDDAFQPRERVTFPTTTPVETIDRAISFFRTGVPDGRLSAVGIGSFGPVDPDPASATYGYITTTPKKGWQHTEFAGRLQRALGLPVGFDTDTNAAALGEHVRGAGAGLATFLYLTVGTGVGGGALVGGRRLHGLLHPEMGHVALPRADGDPFEGACPFHGDCLEGMISGPALEARTGRSPKELPPDHEVWTYTVHYLAAALVNFICVLSPQRIILGGGVMHQRHLFPRVRSRVQDLLNGYLQNDSILRNIDAYIVPPGLGDDAGVVGALALAREAAGERAA